MMGSKQSFKVFACEVMQRELGFLAAQCPHLIEFDFLPVGHHDRPSQGHRDLQTRIDATPASAYDALLIGYGVCSKMLDGLTARHTPLVVPRGHDCITFFLGSKERYAKAFEEQVGTYYFTAGWLEFPEKRVLRESGLKGFRERRGALGSQNASMTMGTFEDLAAKYGEENARYLLEVTEQWASLYGRGAFIHLDCTAALALREEVQGLCARHGWRYEEMRGDLGLLERWLNGQWAEQEVLVVPPGQSIRPTHDDRIIEATPPESVLGDTSPSLSEGQ
jgi:hypothetical protein